MSQQPSTTAVTQQVQAATLTSRYTATVIPEAHGACCVEIRHAEDNMLAWRKRSFESDFQSELDSTLASYAAT